MGVIFLNRCDLETPREERQLAKIVLKVIFKKILVFHFLDSLMESTSLR